MKNLSLLIFSFVFTLSFGQLGTDAPWMQELALRKNGAQPTYQEIKAAGATYWETHDKDARGSGYKPFMRWLDRAEAFVKQDGTVQSALDIENEIHSNRLNNGTTDTSNWFPVGPFTYTETGSWSPGQGRVNTLIVDPNNMNTYYMGTPNGGVWKSIDAGTNWTPLTDFLSQIGASAIAIDPNNSNIVYIGTGDDDGGDSDSIGILKSTDGGATFNATDLSFTRGGENISEIYIDPDNSNNLIISSNQGFYKSNNAGITVTRTFSGNVKDIKFKPGDSNIIYMSTTSSFYRSSNQGNTWTEINSGLPLNRGRCVIGVTPANSNYVYLLILDVNTDLAGVYRSSNSGLSFTKRDNGTDILENRQGWYDLALEVSPTNAETLYTGCLNVWKSTSGGSTFTKINSWSNSSQPSYTHADIHQIRQFNNELFVLSDGGVYRSTNEAGSFTDLTATAQIGQFYRVAVSKQSSANIAGGLQDNGGFSRSANSWKNYYGADGMEAGIHPINPDIRYGFIQNGGNLYFSLNGGNSRAYSISGPETGNWITPLKTDSKGVIYAGYNSLFKVENGAFVAVSQPFSSRIDFLEIDPHNDRYIYAAVNQSLYKSTDAGITFNLAYNFPENISAIEINNNDGNVIYVSTRFSNGQIYRSSNQGASFSNITGNLPNLGKNTLAHQGLSVDESLFVGTTVGVYEYDEVNNTWDTFGNNLPNVNIRDLEFNVNDQTLTAGTFGRGIWQTALQRTAPSNDVQLVEVQNNDGSISCGSDAISILLRNTGLNTINSIDLNYSIDGNTPITQQRSVSIAPQTETSVTISGIQLSAGNHNIDFTVTTTNDYFVANNYGSIEVLTNTNGTVNDTYQFENREFLSSGSNNSSSWQRGIANGALLNTGITGSSNVYATNLTGEYDNNSTSYLYSGCYDLTFASNPVLSFDMAFDIEVNYDVLYLEYSIDGGNNWDILGNASDANWYNSSLRTCTNCVGAQWSGRSTTLNNYSISLASLNNPDKIIFRYVFRTDQSVTDEGAVIDNFVISGILSTESSSLEHMFSIYPNPSTGVFNLVWNTNQYFNYQVYDVSGKKIAERKNNRGNNHVVNLSGVSQGMYFIHLSTENESVTKKLLVK